MSLRSFGLKNNPNAASGARQERVRPTILILARYYLPSEKAGGGMRTIVNMIDRLGDRFRFRVVTTDRDLGDTSPYRTVKINDWNTVGRAEVYYGSPDRLGLIGLLRLIRKTRPDAVYLNSFFSPLTARFLLLKRLGFARHTPTILAPEGELAPNALKHKGAKKKLYWFAANLVGLYQDLFWKAAASHEADAIKELVPHAGAVRLAPNMPPAPGAITRPESLRIREKRPGEVRLIFLARIVPIKNLKWALEAIREISGRITLDVYGPIEDTRYWSSCLKLINDLPSSVAVNHEGTLAASKVSETFARYHFMILPTLGENFGHVIIESLAAGCPVIISNRTPWLGLDEKNVGWDLPLDDMRQWRHVLSKCVAMDGDSYRSMSENAEQFAADWLRAPDVERANADVLLEAATSKSRST